MNPADLDLARRAVACKGWRWFDGSRTMDGYRVVIARHPAHGLGIVTTGTGHQSHVMDLSSCAPDLTDPATLGCLLALVRAQPYWGPCAHVEYVDGWWYVCGIYDAQAGPTDGPFPTEAAALVTALENAP